MNLPFFIAKNIARNKSKTFSKFIIKLATAATILSVAVMIIAVAIVQGFKTTVRDKIFVFWGEIQINLFNPNPATVVGNSPFQNDFRLLHNIRSMNEVTAVYPYIIKPAIVKTKNSLEGIKLKGVTPQYPLKSNDIIQYNGNPISFEDSTYAKDIILSQSTLKRLNIKEGDSVLIVFFNPDQSIPPVRKLRVAGSFHTGMEDIDKNFGICDIRLLRRISNWAANDISGYQINVKNYKKADDVGQKIYEKYVQPPLSVSSMRSLYPYIFSWLDFQNVNTRIILIIMGIVAAINMATALLIFILERTTMIGTLKALGMRNVNIRKIFIYHAGIVALKGILWGTLLGAGLCLIQQYTHIISLNEDTYYMKAAPIQLNLWDVILIDLGTLVFCSIIMLLPGLMVRSVNIVKAIKFR